MKLTSIEIHPSNSSDVIELSFRDPANTKPYSVKAVTGLDSEDILPAQYGSSGGHKFYDLSVGSRTVAMKISLNPRFELDESYSDLRDLLYRIISSSRSGVLQLQFKNDDETIAVLSGLVTKFETAHFEQKQEVQLTMFCIDPMLKAPSPEIVDVTNLDPGSTVIFDEKSSAPHGFVFVMNALLASSKIKLTDPDDSSWSWEATPVGGFLQNDVLYFSSEKNNKYAYLMRGATRIDLGDVITQGSLWPIIFPGFNKIASDNPTHWEWEAIQYTPTYWGV